MDVSYSVMLHRLVRESDVATHVANYSVDVAIELFTVLTEHVESELFPDVPEAPVSPRIFVSRPLVQKQHSHFFSRHTWSPDMAGAEKRNPLLPVPHFSEVSATSACRKHRIV